MTSYINCARSPMNIRSAASIVILGGLLLLAGCGATISGSIRPAPAAFNPEGTFKAGAAKVDITPPPGYPMGGHSIAGKISRGYWLRLYARAIFMEDPSGKRVAMVSTDLWSMPAGLADRVAELNRADEHCAVGREGLIIAATHTHQSPGNFSSSPLYNYFASPKDGFDSDLFDYLAKMITRSIKEACETRTKAQLLFYKTRLTGSPDQRRECDRPIARNRSFEAFMADPEHEDVISRNEDLPVGEISTEYPFPESYRAISPELQVLRIKQVDHSGNDIALAAFYAVHQTSLSHDADIYNSDLFGIAATELEQALKTKGSAPVVAFFNGAEGDISPAWHAQDRRDTLRIGRALASGTLALIRGPESREIAGDINIRFDKVPLPGLTLTDENGVVRQAAKVAREGVPAMGGAEDGRTFFYYLGCKEGITDTPTSLSDEEDKLQGNKKPAIACLPLPFPGFITNLTNSLVAPPPVYLPVGVYSFDGGKVVLATLPGEFTTVLGQRITSEINRRRGSPAEDVILIGLANEYISYFTTREEYQKQSYEGAFTLYGADSGEAVKLQIGNVANELGDSIGNPQPYEYSYNAGYIRRFDFDSIEPVTDMSLSGLSKVLLDNETGLPNYDTIPAFCWKDHAQGLHGGHNSQSPTPRVELLRKTSDGNWVALRLQEGSDIEEDDTGLNFVTIVQSHDIAATGWCVFWMPPRYARHRELEFSFSVKTMAGEQVKSEVCRIKDGKAEPNCTYQEAVKAITKVDGPRLGRN